MGGIETVFTDALGRLRTHRRVVFIAGTAVMYGLAVYLANAWTRNATTVPAIWPASGILLAAFLNSGAASTRRALMMSCIPASIVASAIEGSAPWINIVVFPLFDVAECLLAHRLLRWACGRRIDFAKAGMVVAFIAVCVAAPLVPSAVGAFVATRGFGAAYTAALSTWYVADVLGLLVIAPAVLLLARRGPTVQRLPSTEDVVRHFLLLVAASLVVFLQSTAPLLFLLVPISVLIAFRLGPRYAAMATLWLTAISVTCTYLELGPVAVMADPTESVWIVQLFCFVNLLTSLLVAAAVADRDRLSAELERVSALADDRRQLLDTALDTMSQGVCLFDNRSRIVMRNNRFLELYGLSEDAVPQGTTLPALMGICRAAGAVPEQDCAPVALDVDSDIEQQLVDGRLIRISQRVMSDGAVICTYSDFTAEKRAETELVHRTLHDVLTGLPNRRLLVQRIERALEDAKSGKDAAVMLIDIDHFKSVNDNMGHAAGDELLRVVAGRLAQCVRDTDTVARLGGDEFALLLAEGEQIIDAAVVARRILESVELPIVIEGKPVRVGISIGIAQPPTDGSTTDEILKAADVALYKAKRGGRGNFAFFNASEDAGACSARRLESELRRAVEEKEFAVVYQPIKAGGSGSVAALEALVRWHHPELGTISPAEFIPLAERNGLIRDIGDWVLDQACRDGTRLPSNIKISVNLSRVQVSDPGFVKRVSDTLTRTGLAPERLELEVTETAILHDETNACKVLLALQALGVSVAIDDFGVGQSALSCLKSLPIGRIKIDRSFIDDLATDAKARSIFVAVVSLAKSLGIKTTAEGIETEQQRVIAALAGCDHLQGYLLGRPQNFDGLALAPASEPELPLGLAS